MIDDAESGIAAVRAEPSGKSARPNGTAGSPSDENAVSPIIERVRAIAGQTSPVWKAVATPVGIGWAVAGTVAVVLLGSLLVGDDDGNLPNANSEQLADSLNEKTTGPNSATPDSAPEIPVRINKEHPAEPIAGIAATPGEAGLEPLNQPGESSRTPRMQASSVSRKWRKRILSLQLRSLPRLPTQELKLRDSTRLRPQAFRQIRQRDKPTIPQLNQPSRRNRRPSIRCLPSRSCR
ncbi:MAG: hypothetical protein O3A00_22170 [Planctomycetota bacterium]|nr:hypothetical protein [Planctomycetota bacterium]